MGRFVDADWYIVVGLVNPTPSSHLDRRYELIPAPSVRINEPDDLTSLRIQVEDCQEYSQ